MMSIFALQPRPMRIAFSFALLACCFRQLQAQQPVRLTFREAVRTGLEKNIFLQQQRNQSGATEATRQSALMQMAPSLTAFGSTGSFSGNSFNQQQGEVVNGKMAFVNGSIGSSVPVFSGLSQVNRFRQATAEHLSQEHFVDMARQEVIRTVAGQFLNCLLDQQLLRIDLQNLEIQKAQYDQVRGQVDVGARAEADLYNQEFQVRNAELMIVRSSNRLKNDKAMLAQTLLLEGFQEFELEEPSTELTADQVAGQSVEVLGAEALNARNDLLQARAAQEAARFAYFATRGRLFPTLTAVGQWGSRYNYIEGASDNRSFNAQFGSDNRQLSYGLTMSIPLFNGFSARTQVTRMRVQYDNAVLATKGVEAKVRSEVLVAWQNLQDARKSLQASEAQLKAARLSYTLEKERFDLGISNMVQLVTAQQSWVRAQSDSASARYMLILQQLMLRYATGTLREEDIP